VRFPALDVRGADAGLVLAIVDDYAPSAVDERADDDVTIFFNAAARRDAAADAIREALPHTVVAAHEVDDEDWARRSQENLTPITVGRITVAPPWSLPHPPTSTAQPATSNLEPPPALTIVITPSMGFGTGHHATTRLCLAALQNLEVSGRRVLDIGTGSGVLAIAAARLGAARVLGIDFDPDAVVSARENLDANPAASGVQFDVVDLRAANLPRADIVLANLTGAVLVQNAGLLASQVEDGGALIVSGLQSHERQEVVDAFAGATLAWSDEESGWVGLTFDFSGRQAV
jgi:ribosomal protein L11 methyltransferase